jgi:hypothetical protein
VFALPRADQQPAISQILQVANGGLRFFREAQEPVGVLMQEPTGFGERRAFFVRSKSRSPIGPSRRLIDWITAGSCDAT